MRTILHSDLNNFYASVECLRNPEIRDKPVVVVGSKEDRHGIVLAKNLIAKRAGHLEHYVRSGEVKIEQLVAREKITKIIRYVQAHGSDKGLTVIKAALGDDVSYADIRLVLAAGIK